jgi:hypothetical protein
MTLDLKISVQNGNVTITAGGKSIVAKASEVLPDPAKLGALKASHDLGPKPSTDPGAAPHEDPTDPGGGPPVSLLDAGAAPHEDPTDPGDGPGQVSVAESVPPSVMVVIGSIVVHPCVVNPCVCHVKAAPLSPPEDVAAQ